jgi:hypothetical protein
MKRLAVTICDFLFPHNPLGYRLLSRAHFESVDPEFWDDLERRTETVIKVEMPPPKARSFRIGDKLTFRRGESARVIRYEIVAITKRVTQPRWWIWRSHAFVRLKRIPLFGEIPLANV